jgi:hypothetical protein
MKFAHVRFSEYFTFTERIFHGEVISLARKAQMKKSNPFELDFLC